METMWLDYVWADEEGTRLTETEREYFRDADALHRRRAELEDEYALIIGVHIPETPANDAPLEFLEM